MKFSSLNQTHGQFRGRHWISVSVREEKQREGNRKNDGISNKSESNSLADSATIEWVDNLYSVLEAILMYVSNLRKLKHCA